MRPILHLEENTWVPFACKLHEKEGISVHCSTPAQNNAWHNEELSAERGKKCSFHHISEAGRKIIESQQAQKRRLSCKVFFIVRKSPEADNANVITEHLPLVPNSARLPVSPHQRFSDFMVLFRYVDYMIYCLDTKVHLILKQTRLLCLSFAFPIGRSTHLNAFAI